MTVKALVPAVLALFLLTSCGGNARPRAVPDVRGERLDVAEDHLDAAGLDWEEIGGGAFGVVVRSHWRVCDQEPRPGARARKVRLIVDRSCALPGTVPDVEGESLEDASEELDARGISWDAETPDGDEPLVLHLWQVCDQDPAAGTSANYVTLYVERACDE